ncbi:MAG: translation initiation factor IF-5A [Thaumarchaeota archaeon]|nr:translation initiation factor IF-5A [Nitrososphaerota archaeon]
MSRPVDLGSIKEGSYIIIDGEACRVVNREHFKPGKHGAAKVRLIAISIFTGSKKSIVSGVDSRVEVPMIDKRSGQIVSTTQNTVQVMDLETFETFETPRPDEAELGGTLSPGNEVEYWTFLGRSKIMRIKGGT